MFQHVSDIYKSCDLSIGVFEGPMGGAERGYSTSNFNDGAPLALNFPDAFGQAVKGAGINLVIVANNHLFDVGIDAGMRTLDQLDKIGLDYVGGYRNQTEYYKPKIVNVAGKRIGILAYTYGQNGFAESFFFDEKTRHYERPVVSVNSKFFKQNVELVKADFARLKAENPDMIIVLPHMGEQFRNKPDKTQLAWCNVFVECGADIILSDHPHHVQPIEWRKNSAGKNVLIIHCPGNFVNSYVQRNGDASMIVNCYIDKDTMQPISASVVPIYAYCKQNGMWTGIPTVKALEPEIYTTLSRADYRRIAEVHKLVTGVALDAPLGLDCRQKEYFTFPNTGFVRSKTSVKSANDIYINSRFLQKFKDKNSICFVGDSVTEGTKNGGIGWFEPLRSYYSSKVISRFAKGSQTSLWLFNNKERISAIKADLFVVAIGCNDIRYRDSKVCAMTSESYISNLRAVVETIKRTNDKADFIFIAPWRSLHFDAYFNVKSQKDRMAIYEDYTNALKNMCKSDGWLFIDPNPLIFDDMTLPTIRTKGEAQILLDWIHPTASDGVAFYCEAVIKA
jgi:poly-gamma-glutamate capsule biosynthesis protein CapA/YwtB (metallophosphatase superfamily)/lysophospholipase L1-like esterase